MDFPFKPARRLTVFDTECYRNYWLIKFLDVETRQMQSFPMWPGKPLDISAVIRKIQTCLMVGFNSIHYDEPMTAYALAGASCDQLKNLNDAIIVGGLKSWEVFDKYGINRLDTLGFDQIDIMEVAPGVRISLKAYGGAIHSQQLQDLPIEPSSLISPFQRVELDHYCGNDLTTTLDLYKEVKTRIDLRLEIGERYGIDVRSKSDAQIAEAVIKSQLGFVPAKRFIPHGTQFYYTAPPFISFQTKQLQDVFAMATALPFTTSDKDQCRGASDGEEVLDSQGKKIKTGIVMPDAIKALRIPIGNSVYKFGIGGLHSQESAVSHYSVPGMHTLSDHDVTGYYPELMLIMGVSPTQLQGKFLSIYKPIRDQRHEAKAAGFKRKADSLKIVLNGTFGKLGSKYSILFAPEYLIQVTITGQLCLLMLIESLETVGINVLSANTDGIVIKTPHGMDAVRDYLIKQWERTTGLTTEETRYRSIHMRDVNNYIAIKPDGEVKVKGVFGPPGLGVSSTKAPDRQICADAVIAYVKSGTPLDITVRSCTDVRRFLTVKNVKGGAYKMSLSDMQKAVVGTELESFEVEPAIRTDLGKVVRWYYGKNEPTAIYYKTNNNQVADSMHAVPMMRLLDHVPADMDFDHYISHAATMLTKLGLV